MKYTLLDLVQNVLSSMDSEEVNSINDTVESQQVVNIIKTVYDDIITRGGLSLHKTIFNLTSSGDSTKPVLMLKPAAIVRIDWIKYERSKLGDLDPSWGEIRYLPIDEFLETTQAMLPSDTAHVGTMSITTEDGYTFTSNYNKVLAPNYYTSADDNQIIFDGYDSLVENTLQSSKTICYGSRSLSFTAVDSFVPELQPDQFALLLNEAKSLAWAELKQTVHPKAEMSAKKNWLHLSRNRREIPSGQFLHGGPAIDDFPYFGRR